MSPFESSLPRDEHGRVVGYQLGKSAALLEWRAKKEEAEYRLLFKRLRARNYARERRAGDPEAARRRLQGWRDANRPRIRAVERARRARKRAANPRFCICEECGKRWMPERKGRFCCKPCKNRWYGKRRHRNRGLRHMSLLADIRNALVNHGWLTMPELAAALSHVKRGSLATKLCVMLRAGDLQDDGKKKWRKYALPGSQQQKGLE